jgi:SDR family mycofactocin-dependent oxidoreductase
MGSLDGKVAFITGGARGMGRSHALTLAKEGADIVITDLAANVDSVPYDLASQDDLERTAADVEALDRRVIAEKADVRDQAQLDAVVARATQELGGIDICIANAGIWSLAPYWEMDEHKWQDMIDINLSGVWRTAKAVTPGMIERGGGAIVMISSVNGLEPGADFAHYVSAKHGVIGLMRSVAFEGGPHNIRCNAICPGVIDTPINDWQGAYDLMAGGPGGTRDDRAQGASHWSILRGRAVLPTSAVSNAIVWLVSDTGADVTGVVLPIDGGHGVLPGFNHAPIRS